MSDAKEDTNVRVAVRCRPMNSREIALETTKCVKIGTEELTITGPSGDDHTFGFDIIMGEDSHQHEMWNHIGTPILEKAFSGYNGTIFAYGQTGSGKTWSMQGGKDDLEGVIPRMNRALFERIDIQMSTSPTLHFLVTVSYFELYNEVIFDLLDINDRKKKRLGLEIKEHPVLGVYVKGLKEIVVDSPKKIQDIVDQGMKSRTVATTQMNADSSRSHSVFTIKIHQKDSEDETKNLFAKVNLVDLAGSERVKSTGASGSTLKEGANINKSLSALGNVINALVEQAKNPKKSPFIPYRNSKLTRVLQESLGGNSITVMIAALSPALCNFDETLSTLKYANRAKAIKVRAVKNDESSQVGRLNEEIKALKDKLRLQSANVDTSLLEEKHQQQLRDLEEAMKSTWEEKARISEAHENDRKQLLEEQAEAKKKLDLHQEKNWKLLEEKGDLGLSLSKVNELFCGVSQSMIERDDIVTWSSKLREILGLEEQLLEQDTVVEVYNTALHRDGRNYGLEQNYEGIHEEDDGKVVDKLSVVNSVISVAQWRQFREKFHALQKELVKWIDLRNKLGALIDEIKASINDTYILWSESSDLKEHRNKFPDIARGLVLLQSQASEKRRIYNTSSGRVKRIAIGFTSMATSMRETLSELERLLIKYDDGDEGEGNDSTHSRDVIIRGVHKCAEELRSFLPQTECMSSLPQCEMSGSDTTELHDYSVFYNKCAVQAPALNSSDMWIFSKGEENDGGELFLEVRFLQPTELSSLTIQGGYLKSTTLSDVQQKDLKPGVNSATILPSGLELVGCDGAVEKTVSGLADVISWEKITKKNPPDMFLQRPPVRFLYDVIIAVDKASNMSIFDVKNGSENDINFKDWSSVGSSKELKLIFMEKVLGFVSKSVQLPPPTTANAIVTGAQANLTNVFLQHLCIVAYCSMTRSSSHVPSPSQHPSPPHQLNDVADDLSDETWIKEFKLAWSSDGLTYSFSVNPLQTNLQNAVMSKTFLAQELNIRGVKAKFLRLYPLTWNNENCCLRLSIHAYKNESQSISNRQEYKEISSGSQNFLDTMMLLRNTSDILAMGADFISNAENREATRKQHEALKAMENIVDEKNAQEQALLDEKRALSSEKTSLEEQLQTSLEQLRDFKKKYSHEKAYREQLESLCNSLDKEKKELQSTIQNNSESISDTQTEMLKLQAAAERDSKLVQTLRKKNEDDERVIEHLKGEIRKGKDEKDLWVSVQEDLLNQVDVLTDERDEARRNEEELFDTLSERTNDLEKLQESYVNMTDRCNDYQDEICDLRESIEGLECLVSKAPASTVKKAFDEVVFTSQSTPSIVTSCANTNKNMEGVANVNSISCNAGDVGEENDNYDDEFEDDFDD